MISTMSPQLMKISIIDIIGNKPELSFRPEGEIFAYLANRERFLPPVEMTKTGIRT